MGGTPPRYVATELSKLGKKGMTGHLGLNLSIDFVTALKKNSVWKNKFGVENPGFKDGPGDLALNLQMLWIGVQFSFFEANSGMDSRMLVVGICTGYIIVVVVITLWGQHTQWHVCIHHWDFREVLICVQCVVSAVLISRYNSPTLVICEC